MKNIIICIIAAIPFLSVSNLYAQQPRAFKSGTRSDIGLCATAVGAAVVLGLGIVAVCLNNNSNTNQTSHSH
ncbi:MAG: hypothetical protein NTY13_02880 [Chlamydiae bacterium]|nr:hypothetical protein [Chlamydiota bacterium]